MWDVASSKETRITNYPGDQVEPDISGDRIVWKDYRDGVRRIYVYDLNTGTESTVAPNALQPRDVGISGDRIVYADRRNGDTDVYVFDVVAGVEIAAIVAEGRQWYPAISGDRVVWEDGRTFGTQDIYVYDLASGTEAPVTQDAPDQYDAAISGDRIVWSDRNAVDGEADIYMAEISTAAVPSIEAMIAKVDEFVASGEIDNYGIAETLYALLDQAAATLDRGNFTAATNTLDALINFVIGQRGKHIAAAAADVLIAMAQDVIAGL
jgi:beta propeller repeat protein